MELNHRFLDVSQASLPLDHGTVSLNKKNEWTHRKLHPDYQRAELVSSCWTMSPYRYAEAVGLEPTSDHVATCFQDRLLIQPDDFRSSIHKSCGSWNRTNDLLVQSQASLPTATVPHR
jgi:hypothetical protein